MGTQPKGKEHEGQMAWFAPGKDPTQLWEMHPISEPSSAGKEVPGTFKFSHGLGVGDVNGDGRLGRDLHRRLVGAAGHATTASPGSSTPPTSVPTAPTCTPTTWTATARPTSSAARPTTTASGGISRKPARPGDPLFIQHDLFKHLFSQTHALHFVDINGDGLKDLVTGKRWWAHGPRATWTRSTRPCSTGSRPSGTGTASIQFTPHQIDDDSGIGTQFVVADINGDELPDIVVANKKGVFLFEQVRDKRSAK